MYRQVVKPLANSYKISATVSPQDLKCRMDQITAEKDALSTDVQQMRDQAQASDDRQQALNQEIEELKDNLQQKTQVVDQLVAENQQLKEQAASGPESTEELSDAPKEQNEGQVLLFCMCICMCIGCALFRAVAITSSNLCANKSKLIVCSSLQGWPLAFLVSELCPAPRVADAQSYTARKY